MRKNLGMTTPRCGNFSPRLLDLFRASPDGGVPALFEGRRISWSFNTRVAIRAACDLLGLGPGDEVLIPAYNCGSEADPFVDAGCAVPLYEVGADTVVDPDAVAARITDRTCAVYVIHYFGMLQPHLGALRDLCDRHGLRLIEDCALSLLSGDSPAEGRTGDLALFCLYKFFPVVGGGALVVNAPDLPDPPAFPRPAPRTVVARALARSALLATIGERPVRAMRAVLRGGAASSGDAAVPDRGIGTLEDMPAHYYFDPGLKDRRISRATARAMRAFDVDRAIGDRRRNWRLYAEALGGRTDVRMLMPDLTPGTCPMALPLVVPGRDRVARVLQARGIGATPWWAGFDRHLDWTGQETAVQLKSSVLALPLHPYLSDGAIPHILTALDEALRR